MTQPSKAYIDHIMAHEEFQRRVNEQWLEAGISVGDACIGAGATLGHVMRMPAPDRHGSHRTSWVVIHPAESGTFRTAYAHLELLAEEWQWLPSLSDLLGMIEDAFPHVRKTVFFGRLGPTRIQLRAYPGAGTWRCVLSRGQIEATHASGWQDEPEIAAAELLESLWAK